MPPKKITPRQPPRARTATENSSGGDVAADAQANSGEQAGAASNASETSAPRPASRPPVQRLASLKGRTSASPAAAGAAGSKAQLKFKPKNTLRRSEDERLQAERTEVARLQARQAAVDAANANNSKEKNHQGSGSRGRGRGGFSRGGRGGRGGFADGGDKRGEGMASGPFSSMADSMGRRKPGQFGSGGGANRIKREGGPRIKSEFYTPDDYSSDDDDATEGPRIAVEHINLISDSEGEDDPSGKGKGRARNGGRTMGSGLKPIRVDRVEHVDRQSGVSTEASSSTSAELRKQAQEKDDKGGLFVPEDEPEAAAKKDKGKEKAPTASRDEQQVQVKQEPTDEATPMDVDAIPPAAAAEDGTAIKQSLSPEQKKKRVKMLLKPTKRRKPGLFDFNPVLQTNEDREEWERHQEDVQFLARELGMMKAYQAPDQQQQQDKEQEKDKDAEGDVAMAEGEANTDENAQKPEQGQQQQSQPQSPQEDRKEGLIYLFQFPPIVPSLVNPVLKKEEDGDTADGNTAGAPAPSAAAGAAAAENSRQKPIVISDTSSSSASRTGRRAPDAQQQPASHETEEHVPPPPLTAPSADIPSGFAGKLRVHQSGRVTLAWGNTALELSRGADCEFLQDAMLANPVTNNADASRSGATAGGAPGIKQEPGTAEGEDTAQMGNQVIPRSGWALGQVRGKFVVTPDWSEMFS
ncbi:hypothetical protein L228DRAFT_257954 [Xylona heveae TC161]|uniref:DNA-directed RNA polymerase III RPC4 n=1 Tax=Xylona heveae (strain CBS 132557 / TC161) TaxID=1328760 RepID=A0A165JRB5_XYLHT|nr:hypothetical protein L228DRAFT_257954 [Xylona heveae TC161]KZF26538.1 hypothetical protein L228DRAFT_257954 [Xylona heveae TC161]